MPPLVSIIIPAYNASPYIAFTLRNLQSQSYPFWECIVIDDGSTDDTKCIVESISKIDARIAYAYQSNAGAAAARNVGLQLARGEYIQFLDADDALQFDKIRNQLRHLDCNPQYDMVVSQVYQFHDEQELVDLDLMHVNFTDSTSPLRLMDLMEPPFAINAPLLRRQVVDKTGLFDASLRQIEDWDYWIRCIANGCQTVLQYCDNGAALVRMHKDSLSANRADALKWYIILREKINKQHYPTDVLIKNEKLRKELVGLYGIEEICKQRFLDGLRLLFQAIVIAPTFRVALKWLACMAVSPFCSPSRLRQFVSTPIVKFFSCKHVIL